MTSGRASSRLPSCSSRVRRGGDARRRSRRRCQHALVRRGCGYGDPGGCQGGDQRRYFAGEHLVVLWSLQHEGPKGDVGAAVRQHELLLLLLLLFNLSLPPPFCPSRTRVGLPFAFRPLSLCLPRAPLIPTRRAGNAASPPPPPPPSPRMSVHPSVGRGEPRGRRRRDDEDDEGPGAGGNTRKGTTYALARKCVNCGTKNDADRPPARHSTRRCVQSFLHHHTHSNRRFRSRVAGTRETGKRVCARKREREREVGGGGGGGPKGRRRTVLQGGAGARSEEGQSQARPGQARLCSTR